MPRYRNTDHEDADRQAEKERFHEEAESTLLGLKMLLQTHTDLSKYTCEIQSNHGRPADFGCVSLRMGGLAVYVQGDMPKLHGQWQVLYRQCRPTTGDNRWTTLYAMESVVPDIARLVLAVLP